MRRGTRIRSWWALALLLAAFSVLPLAGLAYLIENRATNAVRNRAQESLSSSASLTALFLGAQLRGIQDVVDSYGHRSLLLQALDRPGGADTAELTRQMHELQRSRSDVLNVAGIADTTGTMIAGTVAAPLRKNFSDRDWFRGVMRTGKAYVSEAIVGASPGSPLAVAAATPVRDHSGRLKAIIVVGYTLEKLQQFAQAFAVDQGIDVTVTDQRGVIIARPGSAPTSLVSRKNDPRVRDALVGKAGIADGTRNAEGEPVLSAYAPVPDLGWTVVAEVSRTHAYSDVGRLRSEVIAITVPLAILFTLGGVFLARSIRSRDLARAQIERMSVETRALLDSAGEAIWGLDRDGRALFVNRATHDLLGWEPEEVIGRVMHDLVHHTRPDGSAFPATSCPIMAVARGGSPVRVDTEVLWRKDGTSVPVEYRATPLVVDGEAIGAVVTSLDITDRLKAADALRAIEAERRLAKSYRRLELLRDIDRGILAAGSLEDLAAQTVERLLELIPVEQCRLVILDRERQEQVVFAVSSRIDSPQPGTRIPLADTPFAQYEDSLRRGERLIVELDRHADSPVFAERRADGIRVVSAVPLLADGELIAMLTFSTSGTEPLSEEEFQIAEEVGQQVAIALRVWQLQGEAGLRLELARTNERLRAADEMKNLFLAAASHDVRGRIAAILGYGDLVVRAEDDLGVERTSRFVHEMIRSARTLDGLVSDLLNLDRLSAGALEPVRSREDLAALIRRVVDENGITSRSPVEVAVDQITIDVDRVLIERAVDNLIKNAERYTPPGTAIWVRAQNVSGGVEILVEDAGPGVPPRERERIFERFRRGTGSSQLSGGSGVGLYLVARFAELHGGRAWVQERDGGGASFRMFLPD